MPLEHVLTAPDQTAVEQRRTVLLSELDRIRTILARVKRIGGSLGVIIPRDFAEAMHVKEGSDVRLTLVGKQIVVEPLEGHLDEGAFRRAFAAVLRRHRPAFERLAAHDRGDWRPARR